MRDAPYSGIYLAVYAFTRRLVGGEESHVTKSRSKGPDTAAPSTQSPAASPKKGVVGVSLVSGLAAGAVAAAVTQPFDVLRT